MRFKTRITARVLLKPKSVLLCAVLLEPFVSTVGMPIAASSRRCRRRSVIVDLTRKAALYVAGAVGLGSLRLSILDLSDMGHQPMLSPDGQVVLVFNGEIYNYIELRAELQALGHVFRSSGDTEVLLHAYLRWGTECLNRLNGMWAFLIYDIRQRKLFGSRDRFGEKPLYYYRGHDAIFFGSEIKAILASGVYQGRQNWGKVAELLLGDGLENQEEDGRTFYSEIHQLPAAHAFELSLDGGFRQWRFWSPENVNEGAATDPDPSRSFYEIFENACSIRTRSDVPVGVLLSGGIDSASVACCIANMRNGKISSAAYLRIFLSIQRI